MGDKEIQEVQDLELISIIGFDGSVKNGLKLHPNKVDILYPLGCKVAIQNWETKHQEFLSGHSNIVTTIDISPNGIYVASGQITHMGFKASVYIWDFATRTALTHYEIHKVRVQSVVFSCDNAFVISLGGRDDCNVVVYDMEGQEPLCGSAASSGTSGDAVVLCSSMKHGIYFLSGGDTTLRLWKINYEKRKVLPTEVKFGMIKRNITCVVMDHEEEHALCGTTTGDIVKVRLNYPSDITELDPVKKPVLLGCYGKYVSKKRLSTSSPADRYCNGVSALTLVPKDPEKRIIVAGGDGSVEMVVERDISVSSQDGLRMPSLPQLHVIKSTNVNASATSLQMCDNKIFVGTIQCEVYVIDMTTFDLSLHITCHTNTVFDVAFPHNYPEVFATCSKNDIRVWNTETHLELLRISVPNFTCSSIKFAYDGKSIISGWNDGHIRCFTPITGRMIYQIHDTHNKGVSALEINDSGSIIVSGGGEGQVRVWAIKPACQKLAGVLKEHKAPVSSIHMACNFTEVVSSSIDGTCIIWDIVRMMRKQILFANTQFMCARYFPTGVQVVTTGTDRKIGYWEVFDGSLLRELEGSTTACLNALDISHDGNFIATGGNDLVLKIWKYQEGSTTHIGTGHAGIITGITFSPADKYIVSISADGGIFKWRCPKTDHQGGGDTPASEAKASQNDGDNESVYNLVTAKSSKSIKDCGKKLVSKVCCPELCGKKKHCTK